MPPTRTGDRRGAGALPGHELRWAAGLTLLAWIHRLAFLLSNEDRAWGFSIFYEGDSERFHAFARAILAGQAYDGGVPFHPPGFPLVLAGLHALVGAGDPTAAVPHTAVRTLTALIGSLPIGLLFLLARPYLGASAALLAAGLSLYSFGLQVLAVAPVGEGLYLTLLLAALLLWSRRFRHPLSAPGAAAGGPATGLGLGALLGALALVRAEGALIALLLAAVGFAGMRRSEERRTIWRPWLWAALGWALAVAPWTVRNAGALDRVNRTLGPALVEPLPEFVPITLYGPLNLALANHGGAEGGFAPAWQAPSGSRVELGGGALSLRDPDHLRLLLHGDRLAWSWIRAHPGDFARLVLRKWGLVFGALRLGWTQWNVPGGLAGVRRPVDLFVPHSPAGLWLVAPLLALGLAGCLARRDAGRAWGLLVLLSTGATLATTALFFGYARAGVVMLPLWLSLPIAGLGRHLGLPLGAPGRRLARAGALVALLLLALEVWGSGAGRSYTARGEPLPGAGHLNPDAAIELEIRGERPPGAWPRWGNP